MVPSSKWNVWQAYLTIALLCAIAGAVDASAYLNLGGLFVANLTGNTIFLAYHLVEGHWWGAAERLGVILAFFSGVVTNNVMARWIALGRRAWNPVVASLIVECGILCALAFLDAHTSLRVVLLLTLAWTMGLQNDAFQTVGPLSLNTAFITGDIQKLGSAIVEPSSDAAAGEKRRQKIIGLTTGWLACVRRCPRRGREPALRTPCPADSGRPGPGCAGDQAARRPELSGFI
jgi:uncharacterized membrane protein YoaK (UPF0700 family)